MASGLRGRWVFLPSGSCRPRSSSNDDDEFCLPLLSRGYHASFDDSSKTPRKNMLPASGSGISGVFFIMKNLYITFLAKIKALWYCKTVAPSENLTMVKDDHQRLRQSPVPGLDEKYCSNLLATPSHSLASAGGSLLAVILGQSFANSALTLSHLSTPGSVSGLMASTGHSGSHTPQSMHSSGWMTVDRKSVV